MRKRVVDSINNADGSLCVDLFVRPDGSYGFESYRRDVEDPSGWFAISSFAGQSYSDRDTALVEAQVAVAWLAAALEERR